MKIKCPSHDDTRPSLHLYPNGAYCFVCAYYSPLDKLGLKSEDIPPPEDPEPITEFISHIKTLPTKVIRGLELPYDDLGYYLVWPDESYYLKRLYDEKKKYYYPTGHRVKPYYLPQKGVISPLIVVEGQLNALSLQKAGIKASILSPGGVGKFKDKNLLPFLLPYSKFILLVDRDIPGVKAAIELKAFLMANNKKDIIVNLMAPDANDLLIQRGPEFLRDYVEEKIKSLENGVGL